MRRGTSGNAHKGSANCIRALDALKARIGCLPVTEAALLQASDFRAFARIAGIPTADRLAPDADALLAGQDAGSYVSLMSMGNSTSLPSMRSHTAIMNGRIAQA